MLINTNAQAASTIQHSKRSDMDPANAAASTLYSGALQAAQNPTVVPATTQKSADKAVDNINEAFAKTRVQLQANTSATPSTTGTPKAEGTTTARSDFNEYMSKTPAERIREQLLKERGLTEEDVQKMPLEQQDAIGKEVAQRLQAQQTEQVAATTANPQAQAVKDTLAAI
ncbi:hypothetical protein [Pseudomonas fluorescens]|uniref:hypothetical protein n=1 Tax=Pseudomonas fluorescens TaxID=294 RepID=UPI001BE53FAB|nr:hypothetical protein [Pseudomonas fluorescens]MBT2374065.1 hypothetical protein [Pseudomonas fluorescens]